MGNTAGTPEEYVIVADAPRNDKEAGERALQIQTIDKKYKSIQAVQMIQPKSPSFG